MQTLIYYYWYYSGILLIIYTWCFLAFPYLVGVRNGNNKRKATFSDIAALPKYKLLMNPAIISIGLTQIVFLTYILKKFSIPIWPGGVLYMVGSLSLILCGACDNKCFTATHLISSRIYFVFISIGALLLSFYIDFLAIAILIGLFFGLIYFYFRGEEFYAELWVSIMSTLWGLSIYLIG